MCGFAGFYGKGSYDRENVIDAMGEKIKHRGPDSDGVFVDENVAFSFRRLSIIDLTCGDQPMVSQDNRYVMVFNGEIYNYKELREMLIKEHGCTFRTNSDTEVLLQTYITFKEKTAEKLRGMFAFVVYDKEEKTLYGARDPFGIKPLYYARMNNHLLFGSEIKAFLAHPAFSKKVNKEALKMYLVFQYSPLVETIFNDVYKLTQGHYFTYDGENFKTVKYFDAGFDISYHDEEETRKKIFDAVDESVKFHLRSDVEVGSFLSGGIDSSYICTMAKPDKTFSVGFESIGFDETEDAKKLCEILGIENRKKEISPDDFFNAIPKVQYHSDEPHANLSAVPLYFLSKIAAEDVKVVLSGEGADELFAGYDNYKRSLSGDFYKSVVPASMRKKIGNHYKNMKGRGINFLKRNALNLEDGYIGQAFIMDNETADALLTKDYKSDIRYQDVTAPYFKEAKDLDTIHKKMYLDMHLWLPNDILLKADKMTMAHSLELRVPYLDKNVFDISRRIDSNLLIDKNNITKKVFREASSKVLPKAWATRKKKGFPVPIRQWLWEEKYYNRFKKMFEKDFAKEFFNVNLLMYWLNEHREKKMNHQRKLYTVYAFLVWYEQFFE